MLQLVATEGLRVDVQVPQTELGRIDSTTPVRVQLDGLSDRLLTGRVLAKVPAADAATRTFLVRVALDKPGDAATPGMSARVVFVLGGGREVLRVPRDAIKRYPDGTTTLWVLEGPAGRETVREQPVQLGAGFGAELTVTGGLRAGQAVVIRGNEALRAGQAVRVAAQR